MKNLLVLLITLALTCCSKDDKPKTELEKLPPATQTGANTAGCLVDGKAFLPKGYIPSGNLDCDYIDGKDFSVSITSRSNLDFSYVTVISYNKKLIVGEIYPLKLYGTDSNFAQYTKVENEINETQFRTNETITGELKITNHDFDKAILSGTFWFDAINKEGVVVKVREGRFDMHY